MTSSAVRTAARVASEIPGRPFRTRLTVASLTPACLAMSLSLPATLQDYGKLLQEFASAAKAAGDVPGSNLEHPLPDRRRGRDLNPRPAFRRVRDFQSRSFGRSDTSPRLFQITASPSASRAARGGGRYHGRLTEKWPSG